MPELYLYVSLPTVWSTGFRSVFTVICVETKDDEVRVADASAVFTCDSEPTIVTVAVELLVTVLPPAAGMLMVPFVVETRSRTVSDPYSVTKFAGNPMLFAVPLATVRVPASVNDWAEYACP